MGGVVGEQLAPEREWQCDCGKWVPCGYSRHTHIAEPTLQDMIAARSAGVAEPETFAHLTIVYRAKRHPTRERQCPAL
jgi:hypothetical protein